MTRWWRTIPDGVKIAVGLIATGVSVGVTLLLISGVVLFIQGGVQ